MGVIESHSLSLLCAGNQQCLHFATQLMSSERETASFTLGVISVIVWVVAEIPQLITHYKAKSADGLSPIFLITWMIGDLFNLFGCLLEPATLPTQLYTAVLYTIITGSLGLQTTYYGHIYHRLQHKKQIKHSSHGQVETPPSVGRSNSEVEKASDAEQCNEFDDFNRGTGFSSPIPLLRHPQRSPAGRDLFYQSARYLSKSYTPTAGSILAQRVTPSSSFLESIQEGLLGQPVARQSMPTLNIKNTFCLVTTLTFFGAVNLLQSLDRRTNHVVSNPRQQFVIYVGRKLFQVSGDQFLQNSAAESSSIGTFLGWVMAFIYLGGRLPQICLNIRRGHAEGLNPLMFLFALIGNASYVASILVISLDWSRIKPNLPWLVDAGGCVLLDAFILMQFIYFRFWTSTVM